MPFCPQCGSEFETGVERCGECQVDLVPVLDVSKEDLGPTQDIFACYDLEEADIVESLLTDAGLTPFRRDRRSMSFPTNVGETGRIDIAVFARNSQKAREVLQEAKADGVLSGSGKLIDD